MVLGARVEVAGESINGVGVGDIRTGAGGEAFLFHVDDVGIPPLSQQDWNLLVWLWVRQWPTVLGADKKGAVDGGA